MRTVIRQKSQRFEHREMAGTNGRNRCHTIKGGYPAGSVSLYHPD